MKRGQRVAWTYDHSLGRVYTRITKHGTYLGLCRHTRKHWDKFNSEQLAWVHFDGNKRRSRVPFSELRSIKE